MKITQTRNMPWADALQKGGFHNRRKDLAGGQISSGLWELAPGKRSFPLHAHLVTEEAFFVVSGKGKVRTPSGETAIEPGDYVSFPARTEAHQLINDGTEPLVYLAMSVNFVQADIVEYPDSGKVAYTAGSYPDGKRSVFFQKDKTEYFAGEPTAEQKG